MALEMMVDIETLDTARTAVVLSIGVLVFDENGATVDGRTLLPSVSEQLRDGRTVSLPTVKFWLDDTASRGPTQELHQTFCGENERSNVADVCYQFCSMLTRQHPIEAVWANGDLFDLGILADLFRWDQTGEAAGRVRQAPWRYNAPRDLRTMMREAARLGWIAPEPRDGHVAHSAISDCRLQVDQLMSVRRFLGAMHGSRELMGRM